MALTYYSLSTSTLSSATTSVNITGISQSYTDLRIVVWGGNNVSGSSFNVRWNNVTANSYYYSNITVSFSSIGGAVNQATEGYLGEIPAFFDSTYNRLSTLVLDFPNYTNTTMSKVCINRSATNMNPANAITGTIGQVMLDDSNAITAVTFFSPNAMAPGTTFALYGILKA